MLAMQLYYSCFELVFFVFFVFFFFFFQAEDGIRDLTVTGVQTCALPILAICCWTTWSALTSRSSMPRSDRSWRPSCRSGRLSGESAGARCTPGTAARSEERRVGKECRSRWSPYH